ncbi:fibronectin type III domain-containing protein [Lactococcus cremoris]|uniref:fibronectin type III domain-containing protein n=1 Tax=Lactococcus lactis subsp. cremoris TaxID=1359 RepID=UPI001965D3D1|nr:fibronectin type III domain-containing protein [Lactococcus cremoris]QRZ32222.1 fibronectin type III domain-containing protein [Lactococcus cremoris]
MADKNYLHTAYAYSADGTDRFTTVYPNLNLLDNSSAKTKDGFFKNFDKVENGYGEVTMKGTNAWVTKDIGDGFSINPRNYKPGDKYTMSMDVMFTSWNLPAGTTIPEFWLGQRYFGGSGKRICSIDLPKDPSKMLNQWIRITQTSTIPPYDDPSVNIQSIFTVGFFGPSEGSLTIRVRKPKQEPGSTATPHMLSASEVTTADWPKYVGTYVDTNPVSSTESSKYVWDEMKYRVYLDGTPVGGSKLLSFDLENLKADTTYNVQVSQINGKVESDKSKSVAFKTTLIK